MPWGQRLGVSVPGFDLPCLLSITVQPRLFGLDAVDYWTQIEGVLLCCMYSLRTYKHILRVTALSM